MNPYNEPVDGRTARQRQHEGDNDNMMHERRTSYTYLLVDLLVRNLYEPVRTPTNNVLFPSQIHEDRQHEDRQHEGDNKNGVCISLVRTQRESNPH